jgi:hypothetical protein
MRHVYSRPRREDRTVGQKHCRAWLKEDLKGFMAAKTQLEEKLQARVAELRRKLLRDRLCQRCKRIGCGTPLMSCQECNAWWPKDEC